MTARHRPPRRTIRRLGATAVALALMALVTACDDPPTTRTTSVTYDCQINPNNILLATFSDDLVGTYDTVAPQAVAPSGAFVVKMTPKPFTIDASTSGGTVTQISNLVYKVAIPAGASLTAQSLSGWANVGATAPTSVVSGSSIVITVPGPILASAAATLPTLTMELTATGALGSRVEPKIGGTSYASPGLSFGAKVTGTILGTLDPTLKCFPGPSASPALHSTLISNDTLAPKITITAPVADASIARNATVLADFSCSDGNGVGVASCVGTVADGAPINTASAGAKTFTVTATDNEGKVATTTVTYTVL